MERSREEIIERAKGKRDYLVGAQDNLKKRENYLSRILSRGKRNSLMGVLPEGVSVGMYENVVSLNERMGISSRDVLSAFANPNYSFGSRIVNVVNCLYENGIGDLKEFASDGVYSHKTYGLGLFVFEDTLSNIITRTATSKDLEFLSERIKKFDSNERMRSRIFSGIEKLANKNWDEELE